MDSSPAGRKPRVTDEEILTVLRETDDPVLSTSEIAEELPLKRRSVYDRLTSLAGERRIQRKQIGGRNTVWWIAEDQR